MSADMPGDTELLLAGVALLLSESSRRSQNEQYQQTALAIASRMTDRAKALRTARQDGGA